MAETYIFNITADLCIRDKCFSQSPIVLFSSATYVSARVWRSFDEIFHQCEGVARVGFRELKVVRQNNSDSWSFFGILVELVRFLWSLQTSRCGSCYESPRILLMHTGRKSYHWIGCGTKGAPDAMSEFSRIVMKNEKRCMGMPIFLFEIWTRQ